MIETSRQSLWKHPVLRQFFKFGIIGASSAVINVVLFRLLNRPPFSLISAQVIAFLISVINSYLWNSLWTFRGMGTGAQHTRLFKFLAINLVGLGLNLLILESLFFVLAGRAMRSPETDNLRESVSQAAGIVLVAFWNFFANKKWTFKEEPAATVDTV